MSDYDEQDVSVEPSAFDRTDADIQPTEQPEQAVQETVYDVDGEQVAYSKLSPEHIDKWYKANSERNNWQQSNTQKAQELAEQRKQWEGEKSQHDVNLQNYNVLQNYIQNNPELAQMIQEYSQTHQAQNNQMYQNQQQQQVQQQQQYQDPRVSQLESKMNEIEERRIVQEQRNSLDAETNAALVALKAQNPNFNEEAFLKFKNEKLVSAATTEGLYSLINLAMQGQSRAEIAKEEEAKVLNNIKNKQSAAIEIGNGASATNLPNNDDNSQTMDQIFNSFKEEQGLLPEVEPEY